MRTGVVKFFDNEKRFGFVNAGLKGDVRIHAKNHGEQYLDDIFRRRKLEMALGEGDEVAIPIVLSTSEGLDAPVWSVTKLVSKSVNDLEGVEHGPIDEWKSDKGYGFIRADGLRLFAHIRHFHKIDKERLRKLTRAESAGFTVEPGTNVCFIRGIDDQGRPEASVWFLKPC